MVYCSVYCAWLGFEVAEAARNPWRLLIFKPTVDNIKSVEFIESSNEPLPIQRYCQEVHKFIVSIFNQPKTSLYRNKIISLPENGAARNFMPEGTTSRCIAYTTSPANSSIINMLCRSFHLKGTTRYCPLPAMLKPFLVVGVG